MDMAMEPIKKVSVAKMIQSRILDMIQQGAIHPGDKLPSERELCDSFQVSRTSLREAIGGLAAMGVLKKRSDGIYAREDLNSIIYKPISLLMRLQNVSMAEVFEARIATESQVIALATIKATPEDIRQLETIVELTDNAPTEEECCYQAARFHRALADMTHNSILSAMFSVLYDTVAESRRGEYFSTSAYHRELLNYIRNKDHQGAAEAMRRHIETVKEYTGRNE